MTGVGLLGASAAVGGVSAGSSDHPNTITFDGTGSPGRSDYTFSVSGSVEPDGDVGAIEAADTIDGASVSGAVHRDVDAYRFSGTLTELDVVGTAAVSLTYGDQSDTAADRLRIIAGSGSSTAYEFTTSGRTVKVTDTEDAANSSDSVTANGDGSYTVSGDVSDTGGDTYDFWGDVTDFSPMDGSYTLFLNGEEVTAYDLTGDEQPSSRLEIVTPADGSVEYTLTTSGEITKVLDNGDNSAESGNDTVTQNDDGTWTATGLTGNGYGDAYDFRGQALRFEPIEGSFTLYLDGQEVTVSELTGQEPPTSFLEIVTPADGSVEYSLTTTGEITKALDNGDNSAETGNDTVTQNDDGTWTATGLTGNGYGDAYEFQGEATAFSPMEGTFSLYVDGTQVTPYELTGEDPPSDDSTSSSSADGGPIGGGGGYAGTVSRDQADYVARTRNELSSALSSASSGDVVYVPGDETIDIGNGGFDVDDGVTLASNRGIDDAPGALLYTDNSGTCFQLSGDARFTGFRLRGAHPGDDRSGTATTRGVGISGSSEVDNNDIWGFYHTGVRVNSGTGAHIHHNVIRENNKSGLGYGVGTGSGDTLIEYNYFNYNRHSVTSNGEAYGYEVRYNHFGPEIVVYTIGTHKPAGTRWKVHDNVIEGYEVDGERRAVVGVRGIPDEEYSITDNWMFHPAEPGSTPCGWCEVSVIQPYQDEWTNVSFSDNYYGEDANVSYSDIIPGYDGWRSP
jgi:hypothetical protein